MMITALHQDLIQKVEQLMKLGTPFVRARSQSDYWLYARLFASSCLVALYEKQVIGAVIAFRSQENPNEVYVQDLMVHPDYRKKGIAKELMRRIQERSMEWGCTRLWLTSETVNTAAHALWTSMGFQNLAGDKVVDGIFVKTGFKGLGKDRAVYEFSLQDR